MHATAALARWQDARREEMKERLAKLGIDPGFIEDSEDENDEFEDDIDDDKSEPTGEEPVPVVDNASARMDTGV